MGELKKLFEPFADKITHGGPDLLKGSNRLCYVILNLRPYEDYKND